MKLRPLLATVASLVLVSLAGCGGNDEGDSTVAAPVETTTPTALTKEELVAQGDAVCAEVNAAVGTVSSTGTDSAARVSQEADLYGGMVERLKALGEPSDDATGYAEFISAGEQLAQAESGASLAAERGEEEGLATAETEASSALASFQTAASSFGLEKCAEAPSAPTPSGTAEELPEESSEVVEEEVAPEEAEPAPETGGAEEGGGAAVGGEAGGGTESSGGGSGGIGPG
jgi:hypothetical protein